MKYLKTYRVFNSREYIIENFFLTTDIEMSKPLAQDILNVVGDKLGVKLKSDAKPVKASGAEGIVLSIDDFRVVKFFHSIENAAKSIPLLSKNLDFTAKIYTAGKILLNQEVIYFRPNSSYSKSDSTPTKVLYYLVMERVSPDELTFQDVELAYDRMNRLSNLRYDVIRELLEIEDDKLKNRLNRIIYDFLIENQKIESGDDPLEYLKSLEKKTRNNLMNDDFSKWIKPKTKEFLLNDNQNKPLILKRFFVNHLGLENNIPDLVSTDYDVEKIFQYLSNSKDFNRKGRNGKVIYDSYVEIKNLIKYIIVDNKIKWNDIHNGQFARNKSGKLIALDLGVKSDIDAKSYFDKNVSKISLKRETKLVESFVNSKRLNFFDFDGTLLQTEGKDTGVKHWEEKFGIKYPHVGWISKDESLALELNIKPVQETLEMYRKLNTPDSVNILLSDRLPKMESSVVKNLDRYNIKMDYFLFNTGPHKVERLKSFIENFDVYEINLFDDKISVIEKFKEFRDLYNVWRQDLTINIYHVQNGKLFEV